MAPLKRPGSGNGWIPPSPPLYTQSPRLRLPLLIFYPVGEHYLGDKAFSLEVEHSMASIVSAELSLSPHEATEIAGHLYVLCPLASFSAVADDHIAALKYGGQDVFPCFLQYVDRYFRRHYRRLPVIHPPNFSFSHAFLRHFHHFRRGG